MTPSPPPLSSSPSACPSSVAASVISVRPLEQLASDASLRFQLELEFVSLLANPHYLHALATDGTVDDPAFLAYCQYLHAAFRQPAYTQHLTHTHALHFLALLASNKEFRDAIKSRDYCDLLHSQQFWHWRSWRYNRLVTAKQQQAQAQEQAQ